MDYDDKDELAENQIQHLLVSMLTSALISAGL